MWRNLDLRRCVGWSYTVSSSTTIEPDFEVPRVAETAVDELTGWGEDYLDEDILQTYVHPPSLGVALGWRFGVGQRTAEPP
ncbi:MAG TPA: hypothetical protein QGF58_15345 [Myxococcota bacterium]|nr:hypothetical protein [Myxococcota bacterium]